MQAKRTDLMTSVGLLILRVGIGAYMLTHGWDKLQMLLAGEHDTFGDPIGLGKWMSLLLAMLAEFICAMLVIAGLATRLAVILLVIAMGVAAFVVHSSDPFTMGEGARLFMEGKAKTWASKEPALLYLIPFLTLFFTGAGRFSMDGLIVPWWRRRKAKKKAKAAAAAG